MQQHFIIVSLKEIKVFLCPTVRMIWNSLVDDTAVVDVAHTVAVAILVVFLTVVRIQIVCLFRFQDCINVIVIDVNVVVAAISIQFFIYGFIIICNISIIVVVESFSTEFNVSAHFYAFPWWSNWWDLLCCERSKCLRNQMRMCVNHILPAGSFHDIGSMTTN